MFYEFNLLKPVGNTEAGGVHGKDGGARNGRQYTSGPNGTRGKTVQICV